MGISIKYLDIRQYRTKVLLHKTEDEIKPEYVILTTKYLSLSSQIL